jgi:anti-sigma factor RsiW
MPCEPYKNALVEAAVSGAELRGELRAHLAACAACRTVFAEEQSLVSSIDTSLRAAVNVEIPASLLPRVRTRIAEEPILARGWTPSWLAMACAAAIIVAFIAVPTIRRNSVDRTPLPTATNATSSAPNALPPQNQYTNAAPPALANSVTPIRTAGTRNPAIRSAVPEVLVPRDQEALLVSYAEQRTQRKRAPLVAANFDPTNLSLLQIVPIQIDQLNVKLMTAEQGQ